MTAVLIFASIGLCLLVFLRVWAQQSEPSSRNFKHDPKNSKALAHLGLEYPSCLLVERIFAQEDLDFVLGYAPEMRQVFLCERRTIALFWLRRIRNIVAQILDLHRGAARSNASLSPSLEIRFAMSYLAFLLTYQTVHSLIWLRGPFAARSLGAHVIGTAERVSYVWAGLGESLDPALLKKKNIWPSQS